MSFVEIGIERQYEAQNINEANRAFKSSCRLCSTRGRHLECDRCGIANAHNTVIAIFDNITITI